MVSFLCFSCIYFIVHHTTPHMHTSTHWLKFNILKFTCFVAVFVKEYDYCALAGTTVCDVRSLCWRRECVCLCLCATGGGAISTPQTAGLDLPICFLTLTHTHKHKHTHAHTLYLMLLKGRKKGKKKQMEKEAPKRDRDNLIFHSMSPPIISSMKPGINPNGCSCF